MGPAGEREGTSAAAIRWLVRHACLYACPEPAISSASPVLIFSVITKEVIGWLRPLAQQLASHWATCLSRYGLRCAECVYIFAILLFYFYYFYICFWPTPKGSFSLLGMPFLVLTGIPPGPQDLVSYLLPCADFPTVSGHSLFLFDLLLRSEAPSFSHLSCVTWWAPWRQRTWVLNLCGPTVPQTASRVHTHTKSIDGGDWWSAGKHDKTETYISWSLGE